MGVMARDVMATRFHTLSPGDTMAAAIRKFRDAGIEEGKRVFGLMVLDEAGKLIGMLSMYDILLLMRPKHIHIWGEMADLEVEGYIREACGRVANILVGDVMTTSLVTITPDTHLLLVVDIMIKKHIRRLPVLEDGKLLGIVYISDVFHHLMDKMED